MIKSFCFLFAVSRLLSIDGSCFWKSVWYRSFAHKNLTFLSCMWLILARTFLYYFELTPKFQENLRLSDHLCRHFFCNFFEQLSSKTNCPSVLLHFVKKRSHSIDSPSSELLDPFLGILSCCLVFEKSARTFRSKKALFFDLTLDLTLDFLLENF